MLSLILANGRLIALGVALTVVGGYVWHCESSKTALAESVALAEAQAAANAKQALRDLKNKERSDENYLRNLARLAADVKRLRLSGSSILPAAGSSPGSAERASFDRPQLDAALQRFVGGVTDLVGEGAKAVEGLDEAKAWAQGR